MATILFIEDEEDTRELMRRYLKRAGHVMVPARSGDEGLKLASNEQDRPELILLDIRLGAHSIDGWEVNRLLKDNPATAKIPVIALTAHSTRDANRDRALNEKFADHFNKPLEIDALLARIEQLLQAQTGRV